METKLSNFDTFQSCYGKDKTCLFSRILSTFVRVCCGPMHATWHWRHASDKRQRCAALGVAFQRSTSAAKLRKRNKKRMSCWISATISALEEDPGLHSHPEAQVVVDYVAIINSRLTISTYKSLSAGNISSSTSTIQARSLIRESRHLLPSRHSQAGKHWSHCLCSQCRRGMIWQTYAGEEMLEVLEIVENSDIHGRFALECDTSF